MIAPLVPGEGRSARVLVAVAVVAIVAIDALYLAIVSSQGGAPPADPLVAPFLASYLGLVAVLLAVSMVAPDPVKAGIRGAASAGLLVVGVLAAFSIGVAVLVAAALCIAALVMVVSRHPSRRTVIAAIAGCAVGVAVLVVGLQVAWQTIQCPASGDAGGTVPTFFGAGTSYECVNGHLTLTR